MEYDAVRADMDGQAPLGCKDRTATTARAAKQRRHLPSNRLKISIGLGKYLGISTNVQDVSIQVGASFGIISLTGIPLDISFETICFYVSGKDKNGCPCGK